ncbi:mitochondrial ribosome-associated GTPase 2 isoform X2 [Triplophysa dalaica]|uniref:mitochondrial ribosome-associated GTPase 2 isoform X2 n=1 Tax=Triplophysa dalaica TaxID=1582913 RepID=UPI0024DFB1FC|nr:mitochondrial ribosome-associated GTPase 2 isoform X2 [Triplophysa dalaica]
MSLQMYSRIVRLCKGLMIHTAHKHSATTAQLSEKKLSRYFVDCRRVRVVAGSGGNGASTFHSEPRKEWGGPDGGNGGAGGDIIIKGPPGHHYKGRGAPINATPGERGQERVFQLELRTMAHAGLVGLPNAGKSSLLCAISNARPAVAAYPFTTLKPHVGIVKYRDHEQVAVADIPGLTPDAHLNSGLGISFLRHIERCRILLYVLDMSSAEPWKQLQQLCFELDQYKMHLSQRSSAIVANKMDLPDALNNLRSLRNHVHQRVIPVSALTGDNIEQLILHLRELYDDYPVDSD